MTSTAQLECLIMQLWTRSPLGSPIWNITLLFGGWKLLLLLLAITSPGPGYDTSTSLALGSHVESQKLPIIIYRVVEKLTRWDGIYFVAIANRGYRFEQEWAFGSGFAHIIALLSSGLRSLGAPAYDGLEGIVAIFIAHTAHLFSVVVLFKLTSCILGQQSRAIAFSSATLHIISPAGLFLSAPYAESSCSFLIFAGCLNFARSFRDDGKPSNSRDLLLVLAGGMFGAATTFRSNGVLNGILLLEEFFRVLLSLKGGLNLNILRRLIAAGIGGLFVGAGFVLPQFIAYKEYCGALGQSIGKRPWCERTLPSIYSFVQDHYWNVGLFRYWTLSNLPLFLLAAPMYTILTASSLWGLSGNFGPRTRQLLDEAKHNNQGVPERLIRSLALSQLFLIMFTLSTAHVQIINRISSAYPVWLWYVILERGPFGSIKGTVQFMVVYVLIQGALFASFLPPA